MGAIRTGVRSMSDISLPNECKDEYLNSLKRRDDLTSSLTLPMGILTILGSILLFTVNSASPTPFEWIDFAKFIGTGLSVIALGLAVFFLARSYFNYRYAYVPTTQQLKQWRSGLVSYYRDSNIPKTDAEIDHEVLELLYDGFAKNAHLNTLNNDLKSIRLHQANICIMLAMALTFATGLLAVVTGINKEDKTYKVRVVEPQRAGQPECMGGRV
jgi:hypothetical protein